MVPDKSMHKMLIHGAIIIKMLYYQTDKFPKKQQKQTKMLDPIVKISCRSFPEKLVIWIYIRFFFRFNPYLSSIKQIKRKINTFLQETIKLLAPVDSNIDPKISEAKRNVGRIINFYFKPKLFFFISYVFI